jgi:hypothetical protein
MKLKKIFTLLLFTLFICITLLAQETKVKNIDLEVVNNEVLINYDILNSMDSSEHRIDLIFVDDTYEIIKPQTVRGDIGNNIQTGRRKTIRWNIMNDMTAMPKQMKPKIFLDYHKQPTGGKGNAFLSLLIPGLGDYFVESTSDIKFKPYLRTISTLGFMGLGYKAGKERKIVKLYSEDYPSTYDGRQTDERNQVVHGYNTDYWLFKHDQEIFYALGATLWLYDIIWVYGKGIINEKHNNKIYAVTPNRFGGINFNFVYTFN